MSYRSFWDEYLPQARYRAPQREIRTDCPRCGKPKHFYASITKGVFLCHAENCGAKGNYLTFLREIVRMPEKEIAKVLRELGIWEEPPRTEEKGGC